MGTRSLWPSFRRQGARRLCSARTREGRRCQVVVTGEGELCRFHSGEIDLSAAGRRGGSAPRGKRGRERARAQAAGEVVNPDAVATLGDWVREAYSRGQAESLGLPSLEELASILGFEVEILDDDEEAPDAAATA